MYSKGHRPPVTSQASLPSPQHTSPSDSETDVIFELDQKRRQIDEEIANFQAQKEKEFRDFERQLRASKRRRNSTSPPLIATNGNSGGLYKPPSRTSSSSALNLLVGRGAPKTSQFSKLSKQKAAESSAQGNTSAKTSLSASQPVVSLDKLNINGETVATQPNRPRTPPTPTLLSRTLTHSSSGSSIATTSPPQSKQPSPKSTLIALPLASPEDEKHRNSFAGLFTPSYIRLLDSNSDAQPESSSALETPPAEDEAATAPSSYRTNILSEILPVSSSSFPPHVTMSPSGHSHTSKRSYTAPTVSKHKAPSALRTASGGAIGRKAKHVTFRLADSAIVEPSSSYEEGLSPQYEDGKPQTSTSGTRSPLGTSKAQLNRTLSPDEEDEEAGVRPGMGMGDVIQRLNEFTVAEAAKHGEELVLEVDENEAQNQDDDNDDDDDDDDDEDDDDDDVPMEIMSRHQDNLEDDSDRHLEIEYHEHVDDDDESQGSEAEEDGYFSPKAKHVSTMSPMVPRGNSPLAPYRDYNWAELSSSDKDRLLFEARRHSDDSDDIRQRSTKKISTPTFDETGFSSAFKQNVDGGSGVGFFELDEELTSPDAGNARPFEFELEVDEPNPAETENDQNDKNDIDVIGLGLSTTTPSKRVGKDDEKRWSSDSASKFGVGSVPIDIIRPSLSVTSSWVGTFGH